MGALEDGRPARTALTGTSESLADLRVAPDELLTQLITAKPVVVLANVSAEDAATGNDYSACLMDHIQASESGARGGQQRCVVISAPLEAEVVQLDDMEF